MLAPGALAGSYRITGTLGAGGMGVVYVAEHVVLGSRAAIKVLTPEAAAIAEIVHRFINEARASAALKHRNIVQVYDCGQLPDGQWFIALEFLEGSPLSRFIASHGGPIALPIIVQILGQAAHGLHVAHENGFVHRDVKPDNIFLTQTTSNDHHVTILDFGIAKLSEGRAGLQTRTNVAMGTPAYMAPEQLRDAKTVDRRSDVYALGVIAYEMATGRRPWGDVTAPGAVMELQVTALRPPNPCEVRSDIAAPFGAVIAKALAVRPEDRFATAQEFILALAYATPGNEWSESGIEILRRYANELVASTLLGLGGFPATHPRALGMMGMHGEAWVNRAVQDADLLIALGMRFDDRVTGNLKTYAPRARKIHVDLDPSEIGKNVPVDVAIVDDVKRVLAELTPRCKPSARAPWMARIDGEKGESAVRDIQALPDTGKLHAAHVIHDLWRLTEGKAIVVTDVGQHQMWEAQYYKHDHARGLVTSGGLGTMGFALPAIGRAHV